MCRAALSSSRVGVPCVSSALRSPARCCVNGCCSTSAFPYDRRCSWASRDAQSPLSCRKARMCVCECVSPRERPAVCVVCPWSESNRDRPAGRRPQPARAQERRPWQIAGAALSSSPAALRAEDAPSARRAPRRSARRSARRAAQRARPRPPRRLRPPRRPLRRPPRRPLRRPPRGPP